MRSIELHTVTQWCLSHMSWFSVPVCQPFSRYRAMAFGLFHLVIFGASSWPYTSHRRTSANHGSSNHRDDCTNLIFCSFQHHSAPRPRGCHCAFGPLLIRSCSLHHQPGVYGERTKTSIDDRFCQGTAMVLSRSTHRRLYEIRFGRPSKSSSLRLALISLPLGRGYLE